MVIAIVFLITIQVTAGGNFIAGFYNFKGNYQDTTKKSGKQKLTTSAVITNDTIRPKSEIVVLDTIKKAAGQAIDTFDVKFSKDSLDAPISYSAEDSGVLYISSKKFILYGRAKTKYNDIELSASTINLDQEKQLITAYGSVDTTGNPLDKPRLVQGGMTTNSDTIFYNLKTQKGRTVSTFLQEGEMFIYARTIKKVNDNTLYAWKGRFTTCNLDTPHFAFRTRKMKIINNKIAVSGPTSPEFEGVPMPIGIPFGIFPLSKGRHSGILPPSFSANEDFGLGLEGLGYYKVLNEYVDVTVRSNIYSYGGWNLTVSPKYMKRYRYNGGLNIQVQNSKILNRFGSVKDEFIRNQSIMIGWTHTRNPKAHPGSNFSALVNAGSSKFNRFVSNNPNQNFTNQLNSSITYTKAWSGKYNLTVAANHDQNNNNGLFNVNLPSATFSVVTLYPFQRKEQVGSAKWYEKLGVAYNGTLKNQISFYDSLFNLQKLLDTAQWGANHVIPITLSLPQLGPVQIAPGISYAEKWYGQKFDREWDTVNKRINERIVKGFYTAREMSFSLGANTRIFGTYQFPKSKGVKAIRHEMRPNISLNYKPDFVKQFYKPIQIDSTGKNFTRISQFFGGINETFSEGRFGGIGFGIDNVLDMKVKDKNDTTPTATKKIKLIDGFGFNSAYNLVADSFALSPFNIYLRSTLFEKINITASGLLDPYTVDEKLNRQRTLSWQSDRFSLGRITNGTIAISTQFTSKRKGEDLKDKLPKDQYLTPDEQNRQLDYIRNNPAEFTDFNIPWSVDLSYSLSFAKVPLPDFSGFRNQVFSSLNANGDFSLTERWKLGGSTSFDFNTSKVQSLTMFVSREMHCWQMAINLVPIGLFRSFNISISPKSGILRDLKINRSRTFFN